MHLDIESIFSHHSPRSEDVTDLHSEVRDRIKHAAHFVNNNVPESPERTLAIRKLQEAMMYANSAIAQHG